MTALLLGPDLGVLSRHAQPLQTTYPHDGWVEQAPYSLLAATEQAAAAVLAHLPPGTAVLGAGLANPGESVLAWDARSGEALTPVLVWSDTRSAELCARLRAEGREPEITRRSGLRLDPYFCAAKFAWLLEHDPAVQTALRGGWLRLCTLDAWISFRLSGEYVTDHSTASRTQLYDQAAGNWDPALLDLFGVPVDALPEIRPGQSRLGTLHLGRHHVPWTAALLDQVAALAGNGCLSPGDVKVTYGTGAFVLAQAGPVYPAQASGLLRTVGFSDAQGRSFVLDGGVYSAGSALAWLERLGVLDHAEAASTLAEQAGEARVRFLPAFSGLGAPWWVSEARGVLSGLSGQTGPAEMVRAVLDGIASCVADILEQVGGVLGTPQRVRADGGLAQNRYLMQRQADLSGLVIERSTEHEATALGVALIAGVGAGTLDTAQMRARTAGVEVFTPSLPERQRQDERERWQRWLSQAAALPRD